MKIRWRIFAMSRPKVSKTSFAVSISFCLLLLQFVALGEVSAQTTVPRPTVTRAFDVFENYPERVLVGTDIVFKRKTSQGAQKLVRSGLHVRVFSLSDAETEPTPITVIGDCAVYLSVVHTIEPTDATEVRFKKMDHSWLNLSHSGNSIKDGRYFFVFEQAGPTSEQFRIKSTDAKSYFSTGFRVVVFDNGGTSLKTVKTEYEKRDRTLGRLYVSEDNKLRDAPCYTYRKLTVEATADFQLAQASLESCSLKTDHIIGI
jgi:hypothetical protein